MQKMFLAFAFVQHKLFCMLDSNTCILKIYLYSTILIFDMYAIYFVPGKMVLSGELEYVIIQRIEKKKGRENFPHTYFRPFWEPIRCRKTSAYFIDCKFIQVPFAIPLLSLTEYGPVISCFRTMLKRTIICCDIIFYNYNMFL